MMNATFATNGSNGQAHAHEADEAIDSLYSWWPGMPPAPAPLPEAALSLTLKGTLGGIEAMLTIRGQSAAEFQTNLAAVRGLLDPPAQAPQGPAVQAPGAGWCAVHQVQMQQHTNAKGSWFSHFVDGRHCKGR
jgi:hypothetical protein